MILELFGGFKSLCCHDVMISVPILFAMMIPNRCLYHILMYIRTCIKIYIYIYTHIYIYICIYTYDEIYHVPNIHIIYIYIVVSRDILPGL